MRRAKGSTPLILAACAHLIACGVIACARAPGAVRYDIDPTSLHEVASETLLGFDARGAMRLRLVHRDGSVAFARAALPNGPRRVQTEADVAHAVEVVPKTVRPGAIAAWRLDDITLLIEADPPLGGRREAHIRARFHEDQADRAQEADVELAVVPIVKDLVVGALARTPDPRYLVLGLTSGDVESLLVLDLASAGTGAERTARPEAEASAGSR